MALSPMMQQYLQIKEQYPDYNYTVSDQIGKSGIELSMEETLRGTKGSETLVIDSNSRVIDTKNLIEPVSGKDIIQALNLAPGPVIKEYQEYLLNLAFQNPKLTRQKAFDTLIARGV